MNEIRVLLETFSEYVFHHDEIRMTDISSYLKADISVFTLKYKGKSSHSAKTRDVL